MSIRAHADPTRNLLSLALMWTLAAACGGKSGESTGTTDTDTTGAQTVGATDTTEATGTTTNATTTDATVTGPDSSTSVTTTDVTLDPDPPDPCASSCASEEACYVDEDASTGVGGDSCDVGFHCVVTMDCACVLSYCAADCVPDDPTSCDRGETCDPNTGLCV